MSRLTKAFTLGLLATVLGIAASLAPPGFELEEKTGLNLLFKLRGERPVPPKVAIVTLDKASSQALNLSVDSAKWPRSHHARLTEILTKKGASVIAFDILFEESRSAEEDAQFAKTIQRAGNVVLCACLRRETVSIRDARGSPSGIVNIEKLAPPISPLAESAIAFAPFPLPKVPDQVTQYWAFKSGAGDAPTLPVVAFQVFAREVHDRFLLLLRKSDRSHSKENVEDKGSVAPTQNLVGAIHQLRSLFLASPWISEDIPGDGAARGTSWSQDPRDTRIIQSLAKMYQGPDTRYLNFYGPPGSIPTIPYYRALQLGDELADPDSQHDLRGKAIFVGVSEALRPEQKDGFYTVFSKSPGNEMSGVEIAATAFANLMENSAIRPLDVKGQVGALMFWGLLIGILSYLTPALVSALGVLALSLLYLLLTKTQFASGGLWFPVAVPLFLQAPVAFFGAILWKYSDTNRERKNIRKAFGYYLPNNVVDQLARNITDIKNSTQLVYGTCLLTDAGQYTSLSEKKDPFELNKFMSGYYESLFKPVKNHDGIVINVVGDSMLALWAGTQQDADQKRKACLAALDIKHTIHQFNESSPTTLLPTRMGLHSGNILLGSIGAEDHYEYRPMGDIVNTASRIEGLNKYLGTGILLSEAVLHQIRGFHCRELGCFLFAGKSHPVVIHELMCREEASEDKLRNLCSLFSCALSAYRRQSLKEAMNLFTEVSRAFGNDGPSSFYASLCQEYLAKPSEDPWTGIVSLKEK
jgi:adenylate cyclase